MYAAVIEETAPADSPSPRPIVVSPNGARLSITMSAISESRLPLLCLGVTAFVCSRLVTAMTGWPSALARRARPTIDPLTPEFDAIRKTSAGSKEYSP